MKIKAFAEKKFFDWYEDEIAVSIRASSGSYGGGSEVLVLQQGETNLPIILESNQNHARAEDTETCPCLPASMGLGGGYVPMVVSGKEPVAVEDDITIKIDDSGVSYSIRAREYKGAQCVLVCGHE